MDSRPPPPQGAPPSYAFVTRMYRRSLRPVVLICASLGGLWSLFAGIGYFRNYSVDQSQNVPHLAQLSLALGVLYMVVFVVEIFGIYAAVTQRVPFVKVYALLSGLSALIVIATSLTRVVTHFVWKNDIINECTNLAKDRTITYFGFWGPISHDVLNPAEANAWCRSEWNHDSWALIVVFLIVSAVAVFFALLALNYYRQLLDPLSPANAANRAPSSQVRMGGFPSHYNPAYQGYNSAAPNLPYSSRPYAGDQGYGYSRDRDAPFAPPYDADGDGDVDGKPPRYVGAGTAGDDKSRDPFADSDGPSGREGRDAAGRPGP